MFQWDVPPTETELPISQRLEPLHQFLTRMQANWAAVQHAFEALRHRAAIQANKRRADYQFELGQQVLVSQQRHFRSQLGPSGPLAPRAAGPFTIVKRITRNTFALDIPLHILGSASPVFHANDLIPYASRLLEPEAGVDPPDFLDDPLDFPEPPLPSVETADDDIIVLTDPSNPSPDRSAPFFSDDNDLFSPEPLQPRFSQNPVPFEDVNH